MTSPFESALYNSLGVMSSVCFGLQYVPQMYLNYNRRSVQGFSLHSIVIKLIGAAFLLVNSSLTGDSVNRTLPWIAFPVVPYLIGYLYPSTMCKYQGITDITNSVKPITQLLSHLPQMIVCINSKTTIGVSLPSQYLNFVGGVAGVIMCVGIPPKSTLTYFIYINSVWQAISIFIMYFYYDYRKLQLQQHTNKTKADPV
ncbi:transmembrane protein [Heterostelium album PN500]|uniref:Transmembrane protein n=1 Tax=Heterostelium pallidum (strain ATCC 26659 / Pp 5 / PN500) TaxID=670386 RepID=D3BKY6_HETP5|nr:transmembrane protein [Heterostelium album PN500]EFA78566.1 transmembrane protein [Heterostelium album PN500]|eukprot:XP_020430690.1 transmembrane protein [Heterostelium album PN500]